MRLLNFPVAVALILGFLSAGAIQVDIPVTTESDMEYDVETTSIDPWVALNETTETTEENREDIPNVSYGPKIEAERHPCQRECERGSKMLCKYDFVIEHSTVMNRACSNCPYNISDCERKSCIPGDGIERSILVVNRQMPGPAIEVCYGDDIEVKVTNKLFDVSTTIHWHGILQKKSPLMDGVPFIAQCPITPQASFLYRFNAETPGTHIWHSHSAFQRGDGIYGSLVVRVPRTEDSHSSLYDFDLPEHTFTIIDWEHQYSIDQFVLHVHSGGSNKLSTLLINGKGRFKKFENGDNVLYTPVATFKVVRGFRYRFRLVNAGFLNCPVEMSVDDHNITVIATDGENLKPVETVSLVSLAGERYDFVLHASQNVDNYWIRFKGLLDCSPKEAFQVAMLQYEGAGPQPPNETVTYATATRPGPQVNSINVGTNEIDKTVVSELSSYHQIQENPALKPVPDFKFYIAYDFYPLNNPSFTYDPLSSSYNFRPMEQLHTPQMNHISMAFPSFPIMTDIERRRNLTFCNASTVSLECLYKYCECSHVLQVPLNAVVEIILIDEGAVYNANHPFHLHGYKFWVIGSDRLGNSTTEGAVRKLDIRGLLKRNLKDPPLKDTISTPDGGYSILRFQATNPGFWLFHCHIDFHSELGMALLFKVGDDETYEPPPPNYPTCGDYPRLHHNPQDYQASFIPKDHSSNREFYSVYSSSVDRKSFISYSSLLFLTVVHLVIRNSFN